MEFEEVELSEAAQFNNHGGWGSFPFADLIFLAFEILQCLLPWLGETGSCLSPSQPGCDMASSHAWEGARGQRGGDGEGFIGVNSNRDGAREF